MAGLLGDMGDEYQGGLLGMNPYTLATIAQLLGAKKGDNWGLNIANIESQRQAAQNRAQQAKITQVQLQQAQRALTQQNQKDALAQRAFAPNQNLVQNDDEGNPLPSSGGGGMGEYAQGLMAIDPMQAVQFQQAMAKDSPYGKVDPKDYTPESVARFAVSRNYADLRPRDKIISDDLGGRRVYRTEYSAEPVGQATKSASPDALITDARTRSEGAANRAVTERGQDMTDARARELNAQNQKPSEPELVSSGYAGRMQNAEGIIGKIGQAGAPTNMTFLAANTPKVGAQTKRALERWVMTPEQQQYRQAQEDWVRAKLRKESGAVIADDEMQREIETYFPQLGDSKQVVAQKARSRAVAQQAMLAASGRAADRANTVAGARPPLSSFGQ